MSAPRGSVEPRRYDAVPIRRPAQNGGARDFLLDARRWRRRRHVFWRQGPENQSVWSPWALGPSSCCSRTNHSLLSGPTGSLVEPISITGGARQGPLPRSPGRRPAGSPSRARLGHMNGPARTRARARCVTGTGHTPLVSRQPAETRPVVSGTMRPCSAGPRFSPRARSQPRLAYCSKPPYGPHARIVSSRLRSAYSGGWAFVLADDALGLGGSPRFTRILRAIRYRRVTAGA